MYILNAFSLNMVQAFPASITVAEISTEEAAKIAASCTSAVGHADTAAVFSSVLGQDVACNRATVSLSNGDQALVGQYSGPRLQEVPPHCQTWLRSSGSRFGSTKPEPRT